MEIGGMQAGLSSIFPGPFGFGPISLTPVRVEL